MVRTRSVLPNPGSPSSSTCPPASSAIVTPRTTSSCPTMMRETSLSSACTLCRKLSIAAASARVSAPTFVTRDLRSSEVASDDGALVAGDQVLFGGDLAGGLGLDQLGHVALAGGGVVADVVLGAVERADAGAGRRASVGTSTLWTDRVQARRPVADGFHQPRLFRASRAPQDPRLVLPSILLRGAGSGRLLRGRRLATFRAIGRVRLVWAWLPCCRCNGRYARELIGSCVRRPQRSTWSPAAAAPWRCSRVAVAAKRRQPQAARGSAVASDPRAPWCSRFVEGPRQLLLGRVR